MADPVRDFRGADGEWAVRNGDFSVVAGAEAVPQGIECRVRMVLAECYLDESAGVDWVTIMDKGTDPLLTRALIQTAIAKTPDVLHVIGGQLQDEGNRDASIGYLCDTVYSTEPLAGQIEAP